MKWFILGFVIATLLYSILIEWRTGLFSGIYNSIKNTVKSFIDKFKKK